MDSLQKLWNAYTKGETDLTNFKRNSTYTRVCEINLVAFCSRQIKDSIRALDDALSHKFAFSFVEKM